MSQPGHHFPLVERGRETGQRNVAVYCNWEKSKMISDSHAEVGCVLTDVSFNSD